MHMGIVARAMTDGSTLLYRSRENLSGKSCPSRSGGEKNDDRRRKMEQGQLLVAEKIGEDQAAGRENQKAKSKSTLW
jgi:hypothetical protein